MQESIVTATRQRQRQSTISHFPEWSDDAMTDHHVAIIRRASPLCSRKTQAHVTAEWNMMAGEWDDIARDYRDSFIPILSELLKFNDDDNYIKGKVVLDFGCGTGMLTEYLQRHAAKVVCLDVSPRMIQILQDKILARDWQNVETHCTVLADAIKVDGEAQRLLLKWQGKVDVVVASLVFCHIPPQDVTFTMAAIGQMLKSQGGIFLHSDWQKTEDDRFPDGLTKERALNVYAKADVELQSMQVLETDLGGEKHSVLIGVWEKL